MAGESVHVVSPRRIADVERALLGIPIALVLFVGINWVSVYNSAHALSARPIGVLLCLVTIVSFAAWLARVRPTMAAVSGVTILILVIVGLVVWQPVAPYHIEELEQDPLPLLRHGAVEPLVTAVALVLLFARPRAKGDAAHG